MNDSDRGDAPGDVPGDGAPDESPSDGTNDPRPPFETTDEADEPDDATPAGTRGGTTKVSKWDRPKPPHDWRYVVGTIGKVLIATGVLLFGFVAYQLWGTGIETARAQNRLEDQFEVLVAESDPEAAATDDAATSPVDEALPDTDDLGSGDDSTTDTEPSADETTQSASDQTTSDQSASDAATETPTSDTTSEPVAPAPSFDVERGEVLFKLEMPTIDKTVFVVPGVDADDLQDGPGHYPDTPLPGQLGNSAVAGHRTTWGEPFRNVDQLQPGDEIVVTMTNGDRFVYDVTFTEIVAPTDYHVVETVDPDLATLTLTSCHPAFSARQRIVVHSVLDEAASAPVGEPTYYELDSDDIDGESTVAPADETTAATDATAESPDDTSTTAAAATRDETTGAPIEGDAFGKGWFHDSSAWPQIALWGAALTLISIGSYLISRRFRHDSIGFCVGIIPFLVCLYFFYQNVNRLLPPGL